MGIIFLVFNLLEACEKNKRYDKLLKLTTSRPEVFCKKGVLRNYRNLYGNFTERLRWMLMKTFVQ